MGLATAAAVVGAVAAIGSLQQQKQAAKEQKKAQRQVERQATATAAAAEREQNRANARSPDLAAILTSNRANAGGGIGSTLLTGSKGVRNDLLSLGRKTLLGG